MADININSEKPKEHDPAYYAVLDDFRIHCQDAIFHVHQNKGSRHETQSKKRKNAFTNRAMHMDDKYSLNTSLPKTVPLSNEIMLLMSELAFWIYTPHDLPIPKPVKTDGSYSNKADYCYYAKIVLTHKAQISQWAFLLFKDHPNDAFLVFKGTDPDKIFDIMADTAVIPMPMWCEPDTCTDTNNCNDSEIDDDGEWQFCGHSGIYATLMRDYRRIYKIINSRMKCFDTLYVIGHSMGGGMAILFGLESIMKKHIPADKSMKIVTFGSPAVISYELRFELLSQNAKQVLWDLHNICHCFVNRFDPIPRVPARIEWMMTVIPYGLKKIIADQMKEKMKLPNFLVPLVKTGVKSGVSKFVSYVEKYLELLRSYHPIGTHYFFAGQDSDRAFITKNQNVVEEIMGFIPPHKIMTSDGQELRVAHFSTRDQKHHESVFSLENVTDVINANKDKIFDDKSDDTASEEKMDLLYLLRAQSKLSSSTDSDMYNDDGFVKMHDSRGVFVAVKNIETDEYKTKKMTEKGWIQLVSNHLMEQYIDLFKAKVKLKHFVSKPTIKRINVNVNHTKSTKPAVFSPTNMLKSGKDLWNHVQDTYQKEKDAYDTLTATNSMKKDPHIIPALPRRQRRYARYIVESKNSIGPTHYSVKETMKLKNSRSLPTLGAKSDNIVNID